MKMWRIGGVVFLLAGFFSFGFGMYGYIALNPRVFSGPPQSLVGYALGFWMLAVLCFIFPRKASEHESH
jgi:hypothetical protein